MFLEKIKEVCKYEKGGAVYCDGIYGNPNWRDFDVNDRNHWMYTGLNDNEFESMKERMEFLREQVERDENRDPLERMSADYRPWISADNRRFFKVYESEKDYEDGKEPIAYLVTAVFDLENEMCSRAMALVDEVKGWELGKIQAFLLNRLLNINPVNDYTDENTIIPFDGNNANVRKINASSDKNGLVLCKRHFHARSLTAMEREFY